MTGIQDVVNKDEDEKEEGGGQRQKKKGKPVKSNKRQAKDKKFGFGGRKKGSKKNDSKSVGDMSAFSEKQNSDVRGYGPGETFKGIKKKKLGKPKSGKQKRPGKNKRNNKQKSKK